MKKRILVLLVLLMFPVVFAAVNPALKDCLQRGYNNIGEYCIFSDGSNCTLESFNQGDCGQQFMIEDYCVKEGVFVWEQNKCCNGLAPHLVTIGQATCQPFSKRLVDNLKYNPIYWVIGIVIILVLIYFLHKYTKK